MSCLDVDVQHSRKTGCGSGKPTVERILEFGRELYNMSQRLKEEQGKNEINKKMLQVRSAIWKKLNFIV